MAKAGAEVKQEGEGLQDRGLMRYRGVPDPGSKRAQVDLGATS